MFSKTLGKWLLAGVISAGCGGAIQDRTYSGPAPTATNAGYGNENNPFYDDLAPYGRWERNPQYGQVFIPSDRDFEPYRQGRWAYTDQGPTWVSERPHGWATEHYGSWVRDPSYGWAWVPGEEWSPGRVAWYESDQDVGWAPVGPDGRPIGDDTRVVRYSDFGRDDMAHRYVSARDWRNQARPVSRIEREDLQRHNVNVQQQQVSLRRLQDAQRRNDDQARRDTLEQQRVQDEQRRQYQQQEVSRRDELARQQAEQQRAAEDAARNREAQQRAIEAAERQRAANTINEEQAARLRREAQGDRREEQQARRDDQEQRRIEAEQRRAQQQDRRGGVGAVPPADQRDAQRDQRAAGADQRDAQRDVRDTQRDARDAQRDRQNVSGGNSEAAVRARYAQQHATERAELQRHLAELSAQETRALGSHPSASARANLQRKQQERQAQRVRELEAKQNAQIQSAIRNR